jgi:hypothetical protein
MCTASWLRRDGALHLLFNRDEERGREPASPPVLQRSGATRFLAPRDGRSGGTWIAVTERGLALALLNASAGRRPARPASRGRLIPRLAPAGTLAQVGDCLAEEPLADLPPFRLAVLAGAERAVAVAAWDGERLAWSELDPETGLLCSSALGDERATRERGALWGRSHANEPAWDLERLRAFHRSHDPAPSAWSVCMHRDDAGTVSYVEIEIGAGQAVLRYAAGAPCSLAPALELRLALAPAAT